MKGEERKRKEKSNSKTATASRGGMRCLPTRLKRRVHRDHPKRKKRERDEKKKEIRHHYIDHSRGKNYGRFYKTRGS